MARRRRSMFQRRLPCAGADRGKAAGVDTQPVLLPRMSHHPRHHQGDEMSPTLPLELFKDPTSDPSEPSEPTVEPLGGPKDVPEVPRAKSTKRKRQATAQSGPGSTQEGN